MQTLPIIPKPTNLVTGEGLFTISSATVIFVSPGAMKIAKYLQTILNLPIKETNGKSTVSGSILLTTDGADLSLGKEGYKLEVTPGSIVLRASQVAGLFYGVQTLRLLLSAEGGTNIPAVSIKDKPRFQWRGFMLDVGRHFFPMEFILHLIDVMALHKLNVLHWHLTDDQGWRIEIKKYPRLLEVGSRRDSSPIPSDRKTLDGIPHQGFYTQDQIKQVVAYAASRFITVVPEIEMPGHAMGALASYPELGCTGGPYKVRTFWGIEDDVFCAGNDQVFSFLENVIDEVISLFPGEFIHIGGDECPKVRWKQCPKCQEVIKRNELQDEHGLQSYFIRRIEKYLNSKGRRLLGWDEILEGGLAPNASVMSWRGIEGGIQAAKEGHDVVMTPTSHCYLDYYQSQDISNEPPGIGGYVPLEKVYSFDPVPPGLTKEEAAHILGGQGNLWTEYISTAEHAGYMAFPRASAIAEVLWSDLDTRDYSDFLQRLKGFLPMIKSFGINYREP